jgi:hypothetical protein
VWGINWLRSQVLSCALRLLTDDTGLTATTKPCLSLLLAPSAETLYSLNFTVAQNFSVQIRVLTALHSLQQANQSSKGGSEFTALRGVCAGLGVMAANGATMGHFGQDELTASQRRMVKCSA